MTDDSGNAQGRKAPGKGGDSRLTPYMSPIGVWAFGLGTAIGWGSLVVTSSQYLLQAGPLGSILGILVGVIVMLVIAKSYGDLIRRYPDAGGSYTFVRKVLGYDHGFVLAWFLVLTYLAVFWANATSLPLFSRYFLGGMFQFGYLYTVFGYEVYAGEVLLTMAAIALVGILCSRGRRSNQAVMIALAVLFTVGIVTCFVVAFAHGGVDPRSLDPVLLPDKTMLSQVIAVGLMSPWAFIGFESVSHSAEEFDFSKGKVLRVLFVIVLTTGVLYALVTLLSVSAYPDRYDNWYAYLADLGNLSGIEAVPPFYAAYRHLGTAGIGILMVSLLALVLSSLVGNVLALSRLLYRASCDGIVHKRLSRLNSKSVPQFAVFAVAGISLLVPLLGRTPIGWIVDITTIGACIVYGLVSISEFKIGRDDRDVVKIVVGVIGFAVMVVLAVATLAPSLVATGSLAEETYLLVTIWAVLGFIYFRNILNHDEEGNYGKSVIVWVFMLSLVLFTSAAWMQQTNQQTTSGAIVNIQARLELSNEGLDLSDEHAYIQDQLENIGRAIMRTSLVMVALFALAMGMTMSNYRIMRNRQEQIDRALNQAKEVAYTDPLTGVKSKNAYVEYVQDVNGQIESGELGEFAVVVCDVNGLKYINDTFGHKAGDDYIRAACRIVCVHFEHSPVFRIGGDEFVAVLKGDDYECRDEILRAFNEEVEQNIGTTNAVISAGLSVFESEKDRNLHDVFERADALMYERKMQLKSMGAVTRD